MSDTTARLALPMIVPGQAQKEMSHNAALIALDAAVQASAVGFGIEVPPLTPEPGGCWIVGTAPVGEWAGHAGDLAMWTAAGWCFIVPTHGFTVWSEAEGVEARYTDAGWVLGDIVGERLVLGGHAMLAAPAAQIMEPTGGETVDAGARTSIGAILAVLRHHNLMETP